MAEEAQSVYIGPADIYLGTRRIAHFEEHLGLTKDQQQALAKWIKANGVVSTTMLVSLYGEGEGVVVPDLEDRLPKASVLDFLRQTAHLLG
jgi:hypothetical protein